MGNGRSEPWLHALLGVFILVILAALTLPGYFSSRRASHERNASATLKTITSAEADFRGNDRDLNGIQDFWTKDVAGLYHVVPSGALEPIRLIELSVADADPIWPAAKPKAGYWHAAMDRDEEGKPYRLGDRHPSKFGFSAYPVDRSTGRSTFYINEGNTIFRRPIELPRLKQWPSDEELKNEYSDHRGCCR